MKLITIMWFAAIVYLANLWWFNPPKRCKDYSDVAECITQQIWIVFVLIIELCWNLIKAGIL